MESILEIRNLSVQYPTRTGPKLVLQNVNLSVPRGMIVGIAGESGAGKSTLAIAALNLVRFYGGTTTGEILFEGNNLLAMTERQLRLLRGNGISLVFQNAGAALDPLFTVGSHLREVLLAHRDWSQVKLRSRVAAVLESVQLPSNSDFLRLYPHQLSGGMQQRLMIGLAIANEPQLIIADEPTSSLDVTTQAELLQEFRRLQQATNNSVLFISHDLNVLATVCQRIVVLKDGRVVENGDSGQIFGAPREEYTKRLLSAIPRPPMS